MKKKWIERQCHVLETVIGVSTTISYRTPIYINERYKKQTDIAK